MPGKWIQAASEKMEENGTKGKFGKATSKKIKSAMKKGGIAKKRAIFARTMKKLAARHKRYGK